MKMLHRTPMRRTRWWPMVALLSLGALTPSASFAQCAYGTPSIVATVAAPVTIGATITSPAMTSGQVYRVTGMVVGNTYRVYNCGSGTDSQITIYPSGGGSSEGYNDDNGPECAGAAASVNYVCPGSGTKDIKLNTYNCAATGNPGAVTVRLTAIAAGPPATLVPFTGNNSVACGTNVTLQDHAGTGNYLDNANGYTVLNAAATAVININGTYSTESGWDFIRIFAGSGTGGALLFGPVSGAGSINYTGAAGQTLTVQFTSDGSGTGTGFSLAVSYTGACVNQTLVPFTGNNSVACGTNTTLKDHAGDAIYSNNANGYTVLNAAGTATINVNGTYSTESGWDFIRIFAGSGTGGALLFGPVSGAGSINYTGTPGQTLTVQFTSDGSGTGTGFSLAVSYTGSCVLSCTQPAATVTRDDSACPTFSLGVNITSVGDAPNVNLSYSLNGGAAVISGPFGTGNQNLGPFGPGSSVVVTVVHNGNNTCNLALGTFVNAALCNDACANATTISCGSSPVTGTTVGCTNDAQYSDCGAGNDGVQRGVWYKVIGDNNQYTITTCDPSGTGYDTRLTVYSGSCGAFTCVTGNDDMTPSCTTGSFRSRVQFNAPSGTDFYVFVHGYGSPSATGNFILNITCAPLCLPVPGNDVCAGATAITVDAPATAGTNICSGATVGNPSCESLFATLPDVYYSFTASAGGANLVTFNLYTASNLGYALYSACGGTQIACNGNVTSGAANTHTGLIGGNTYFVRVWTDDVTTGSFDIAVDQPCQPAATATSVADCGNGQYYINVNVTSLGTSTDLDITTDFLGDVEPASVGLGITQIGPYPSGTAVVVTLVHDNGGACNLALNSLSYTCPPANDLCADAIAIPCNSVVSGTTVGAGNIGAPASCGGYSNNGTSGVWYTVQGSGGAMTASLCNSGFDTQVAVLTGSCGSFTCVAGNDDTILCGANTRSRVTWNSTASTTYFIYVTGWNTASGAFTLEVACAGEVVPPCVANNVAVEVRTDDFASQTSWEIVPDGLNTPVCSGSGFSNNQTITMSCCLLDGCYSLRVFDSFGDGLSLSTPAGEGGYRLFDANGKRIIDNWKDGQDFSFTSSAALAFCVPLGADKVIASHCDRENWLATEVIIASANAAVSAQWGIGTQTDDGYQFWFLDPDGGYSRRIFRDHATSGGNGPADALRASKLKLSAIVTNPLPANTLLNVRVRAKVNGVFNAWGPACRFRIDPNACTLTKLNDIPGDPNLSCGVTGKQVGASGQLGKIYAKVVYSGGNPATNYRFEFSEVGEGYLRNITTTSAALLLAPWVSNPLFCGTYIYDVRVQASFDGGATYCPYGEVCAVEITNNAPHPCTAPFAGGGSDRAVVMGGMEFAMYPNPNNGDQLFINMSELGESVSTVSMDMFDIFGQKVMTRTFIAQNGTMNTVIDLDDSMAAGLYLVNITAGDVTRTERLVIQH